MQKLELHVESGSGGGGGGGGGGGRREEKGELNQGFFSALRVFYVDSRNTSVMLDGNTVHFGFTSGQD